MKRELTCIVCPQGCTIEAVVEGAELLEVCGNKCRRGEEYVREELFHPVRTLTTTVRVRGGIHPLVPAKSVQPVPREKLMQAMAEVCALVVDAPVRAGEVLLADLAGTGVGLVAGRGIEENV